MFVLSSEHRLPSTWEPLSTSGVRNSIYLVGLFPRLGAAAHIEPESSPLAYATDPLGSHFILTNACSGHKVNMGNKKKPKSYWYWGNSFVTKYKEHMTCIFFQVIFPKWILSMETVCVCVEKRTQATRFPPYNSYALIWAPKNWSFWIVVLEKTLESPLDCKEIQPVHPKGDQSRMFIGRTDAEAETPILGHPMRRADSFEKTLMLGKIEGRRRSGRQGMRWLDGISNSTDMSLSQLWEAWRATVHEVAKSRTWLSDCSQLNWIHSATWWAYFISNIHPDLVIKQEIHSR